MEREAEAITAKLLSQPGISIFPPLSGVHPSSPTRVSCLHTYGRLPGLTFRIYFAQRPFPMHFKTCTHCPAGSISLPGKGLPAFYEPWGTLRGRAVFFSRDPPTGPLFKQLQRTTTEVFRQIQPDSSPPEIFRKFVGVLVYKLPTGSHVSSA